MATNHEDNLRSFLSKRKVSKGEPFTHVVKKRGGDKNIWAPGSYYIGKDDEDEFFDLYNTCIFKKNYLTIAECLGSSKYAPLRVDFDFKAPLYVGTKIQYNLKIVKHIVGIYQDEIKKILLPEVSGDKSILDCVVLEKSSPREEGGLIKDGFHLHFPHFICESKIQDIYLRENVTKRMISENVWPEDVEFDTPYEELIDTNMFRKPWMMYGSMNYKNIKSEPYLFKRTKDKNLGYALNHAQNVTKLSIMFDSFVQGRNKKPSYYLPQILSIRGHAIPTEIKNPYGNIEVRSRTKRRPIIKHTKSEESILAELKHIEECGFVDMLSEDRANNHESWMDVGWTLYCIGEGHEMAFDMWEDFSRKSSKFTEGECREKWNTMENKGKTIKSLLMMAKTDDKAAFAEYATTKTKSLMWKCVRSGDLIELDIGQVFLSEFGEKYVCADPKRDVWYEFIGNRWEESNNGSAIRILFGSKLRDLFSDFKDDIHAVLMQKSDPEEQKVVNSQMSNCIKIGKYLGKQAFHNTLLAMCKNLFYDKKFLTELDKNNNLVGCENGVIDLELGLFREGRPDDYISMSTGIEYQEFLEDDEEMIGLDRTLDKIFTNPKLKKYYIDFTAFCLRGGNVNKKFLIKTGGGDNGKTVLGKLEETTFGDYFGVIPDTAITEGVKIASNAPRPEIALNVSKRIIGLSEPTGGKMDIAAVKQFSSSGDPIYVRSLHKDGGKVTPAYTPVLQCNEPPTVPYGDRAFWNRTRLLLHESTFIMKNDLDKIPVPATFKEQVEKKLFFAEEGFSQKIGNLYAAPFLFMLFKRYNEIKDTGLVEPEEVKISTDAYRANNDIYNNFVKECLVKISNSDDAIRHKITPSVMHTHFKEWYFEEFSTKYTNGRTKLIPKLNTHLGIKSQNGSYGFDQNEWYGWTFKIVDNNIEPFSDDDGDGDDDGITN
ncbi:PriCT-2 domain-containing protein [bacterium]|nr:PriCT-2 domain-containing protein [bacterium]